MIRFACAEDHAAVRDLWELCFPDEGGFNPYFFLHWFDARRTLVLTEGDTLCAMVQMLPYRLETASGERDVTYIYGACTHPAHRRKGYMAQLLEHSFALDRAAGRAASVLIPAEQWLFEFYRPFGYAPFFYVSRREIVHTAAGDAPRRLSAADIPHLAALYARLAPACRIRRDMAYWTEQIALFDALGAGVYGWSDENGELAAYAFCWADDAQEAVGMTPAREQGLLAALGQGKMVYTAYGQEQALGCIKWHEDGQDSCGYMNLMLN